MYYIYKVVKQCNDFKRNQYMGNNLPTEVQHLLQNQIGTFTDQSNFLLVCIPTLNCPCILLFMWL